MGPFAFRSPRFASAACVLIALCAFPSGCKLERAKVRTAREKPKPKVHPPRTLQGTFVMAFEPATGKRFPVHMSFAAEFSQDGKGLVLSTCVDGLGGMEKTEYKAKIQPDVEVPMGLSGGPPDTAKGVKISGFRCAKDESLPTRAQNVGGGPSGSTASTPAGPAANAPANSSPGTAANAGNTAGGTSLASPTSPARPGLSLSLAPATGTSGDAGNAAGTGDPANAPSSGTTAGAATSASAANSAGAANAAGAAAPGTFAFVSKPDSKGNTIRFTLRANDAGWQIENFNYFGLLAWVEKTETVAQWSKE